MTVDAVIILAAGKSKRMKTGISKVLHPLMGRPMIVYGIELASKLRPRKIIVVVGPESRDVRKVCRQECLHPSQECLHPSQECLHPSQECLHPSQECLHPSQECLHPSQECLHPFHARRLKNRGPRMEFAVQKKPLGTADAVRAGLPRLKGLQGSALIYYADNPLFRVETIKSLIRAKDKSRAKLALLTAIYPEPAAFGRIIRDRQGRIRAIIEDKDCTKAQKSIKEMNPGVYLADIGFLKAALSKIKPDNRQKELYLTDMVKVAVKNGLDVATATAPDWRETFGINSRADLAQAANIMREQINGKWMAAGVTIEDPAAVLIEPGVSIGRDTVIESGARLLGRTRIGKDCRIQAHSRIVDSMLADNVEIRQGSVIEGSKIGRGTNIGPMAHVRPESVVGRNVRIGNFVELKKAVVGDETIAAHLSYLGDAIIGRRVNVGCGVITCNYDGARKNVTIIGDDAFIGSDTQLVAPVRIGKGAYIGSGSTITADVPARRLAIARARQVVRPLPEAHKNSRRR